jgi:phosphocarrier protein
MIERKIEIINKLGLHARAAAKLVKLASSFDSEIHISCPNKDHEKSVSGKSIMGVMMLAAGKGSEITLIIEGDDEQSAADQLEALIEDRFGEGE